MNCKIKKLFKKKYLNNTFLINFFFQIILTFTMKTNIILRHNKYVYKLKIFKLYFFYFFIKYSLKFIY